MPVDTNATENKVLGLKKITAHLGKSREDVRSQILRCWELTQVSLHQQRVWPQTSISEVQIEKPN